VVIGEMRNRYNSSYSTGPTHMGSNPGSPTSTNQNYGVSFFKKTKLVSRANAFGKTDENEILLFEQFKKKYRLRKLNFDKTFSYDQ